MRDVAYNKSHGFEQRWALSCCVAGAKVSDTIRKGIIDVEPYVNNTELLMVGNVAALSGKFWNLSIIFLMVFLVPISHIDFFAEIEKKLENMV